MPFDRATFYASARKSTLFDGTLSKRQVVGTEAILDAWDKSGLTDERWLAYILATTYHETGRAMYPVPEGGRGKGHPYGVPGADGQVAYGRGYVQITWSSNYARADKDLGLGGKLVADFDLALEPAVAAQVLIRGMTEAWFTRFKLADYLNDHLADYLHARRIVNGMDQAEKIAGYALIFFEAIQAGEHKAADHSAVVDAKPASDPISNVLGQTGKILAEIIQPPAAPSPGAPAEQPATDHPTDSLMNMLPVLAQMFAGVAGKLGVATSVAEALPHVISGTIANISEAPKAIAEINKLVADIEAGKWNEVPADLHTLMGEFTLILKNYGIDLSALTNMVPKIAEAPAVPGVAAAVKAA